ILPAAQTHSSAVRVVPTTDNPTCQAGGAGRIPSRISIRNGLAGGNSDMPTDNALDGFLSTAVQTKTGNIDSSMTGIISGWAGFSSLQAEPTAMYNDPKSKIARTR